MTRTAAAVGQGLLPVREARAIVPGERIHVVGAGGAGASAAALLGLASGAMVSGCDAGGASPYTPALEAAGVRLDWAHAPDHVTRDPRPARLAVTKALTATDPDHPELLAARAGGIPVEPWQQTVADAAVGRRLVGVAGTHGKSTSAGWLVHLLVAAGADPSAFVGALLPSALTGGLPATARIGHGPAFVVEADEYAGNFDAYRPEIAVVTNVDWDHPDVFADLDGVVAAFERWIRAAPRGGEPPTLVANVADPGVLLLLARLADWPGRLIATALVDVPGESLAAAAAHVAGTFGTAGGPTTALVGRIAAADPGTTSLELVGLEIDGRTGLARLATAGRHNAQNALGVAGAALALGLGPAAIVDGLATFTGVGRRLERVGEAAGVVVYDDYGHHPAAIRATMAALRQREPGRRLWAVYEPLTFHRTAALLEPFAEVLADADAVVVAEIWAGRDPDLTVASAAGLAEAVARRNAAIPVAAPGSVEAAADWLATQVRAGDAVLVMGGGQSYRIGPRLLERLRTA